MKRRLVLAVLSVFMLAACGGGRGETCQWQPNDNPSRLDLRDRSRRLHLMDEALSAEDRAVRYADFQRGHRSGHFEGNDAYRRAREQCMAMTVEAVANHHGVTPMQVREALTYRRTSVDILVLAVFVDSAVFEMARVGNTHMSDRADRSPWNQYQGELLIAGIMCLRWLLDAGAHAVGGTKASPDQWSAGWRRSSSGRRLPPPVHLLRKGLS